MARNKIRIQRIDNPTTRQVTFSKRRRGLLKKAHDLAVLCDAEVGVIIFSTKGKLFQYGSTSMGSVLERYLRSCGDWKAPNNNSSSDIVAVDPSVQFREKLNTLQSTLIGENLEKLSIRDLTHLERQIRNHLGRIHTKKEELLLRQLEDARGKVTEARKTANMNSAILKKALDFGPSEVPGSRNLRGQGDSEHRCPQETPQNALFLGAETRVGQPATERSFITQDLNQAPAQKNFALHSNITNIFYPHFQ